MNRPLPIAGDFELAANAAWPACAAPAVSVVVSLFNYAAYIEECLASVAATKTENLPGGFEIIIVDDASTDSSAQLVEKFLTATTLPVCLVKKNPNTGVADTRNLGLQLARASFIFILDADNTIRPDCLAAHHHALETSGSAMVYGHINRFDHATRRSLGTMSDRDWSVPELAARPYIDAMAMFRKDALLRVGGYSPELPGWQDYDLCLKLAQAGLAGKMIPQVLSDYRVHTSSMNQTSRQFQRELALYFSKKFFNLVPLAAGELLFGTPRNELALATGKNFFPHQPPSRAARFIQRLLGEKLSRSLRRRIIALYAWLHPLSPLPVIGDKNEETAN